MNYKIFHYYPVDIKNSYIGKNIKSFKFPADGLEYKESNPTDVENLQQMQIYFCVHTVIASLQDLMRVGTNKTNKLYEPLYNELIKDYETQCIAVLTLASRKCWVPVNTSEKDIKKRTYMCKLTPDQALYEIEPVIKGLMLVVQRKMDLTFILSKTLPDLRSKRKYLTLRDHRSNKKILEEISIKKY